VALVYIQSKLPIFLNINTGKYSSDCLLFYPGGEFKAKSRKLKTIIGSAFTVMYYKAKC
jgi:hypothetical protein